MVGTVRPQERQGIVSINRVVISGNLTRDPELRSSQSGTNILTFGMAVNDRRRNPQTGEWEDYANFVDCVLFGNRAEWLARDLHKGKKVFVEGKLRYSTWERDGQRRSKLEVVADDIDYDRPPRQQGGYVVNNQQTQQQSPTYNTPTYNASVPAASSQAAPAQTTSTQVAPTQAAPTQAAPSMSAAPQQQGGYVMQTQQPASQAPAQPQSVVSAPPQQDVYDEDIPF